MQSLFKFDNLRYRNKSNFSEADKEQKHTVIGGVV